MSSNIYMFYFLFRCFINLNTGRAVLNIIARPQVSRNFFFDEKQETLWATQSLNIKIVDFGYLEIN